MAARRHVLVTDAGRGSAVAFIRSLGRRGWRVTAADSDPASAGFRSRYTTDRLLYPRPSERPDAVVDAIDRAVTATGVDLVIPVTDEVGLPLADARATFAGRTVLALPEGTALAATHDKGTTVALAERLGVPVPLTRVVRPGDDPLEAAADLGYPVVVKPVSSRQFLDDGTIGSYAVAYASDPDDLRRRLASPERGRLGAAAALASGRRDRRRAAHGPRPAARRLPAPTDPGGASDRRRQRAARERRARSGPVRPRRGPAARARLDRAGHGGVPPRRRRRRQPDGDQRPRVGLPASGRPCRDGLPGSSRRPLARRVAALRSAGGDRLSTRCPGTEPAARSRVDRGRAVGPSPPRRTAMARTTSRDRRRGEPRRSAHRRRPDDVVGPGSWPRPDPDHRTRFPATDCGEARG